MAQHQWQVDFLPDQEDAGRQVVTLVQFGNRVQRVGADEEEPAGKRQRHDGACPRRKSSDGLAGLHRPRQTAAVHLHQDARGRKIPPVVDGHPALVLTVPVVLYGVMRYLFLVFGREEGGEPENLVFGDPHMIACVLVFLALALLAMSGYTFGFIGM